VGGDAELARMLNTWTLTVLGEMVTDPRPGDPAPRRGSIASSLTEENPKALALSGIAQALVASSP
jgi:hypothetical protein